MGMEIGVAGIVAAVVIGLGFFCMDGLQLLSKVRT